MTEVAFAFKQFDVEANHPIHERLRVVDAQSPVVLPDVDAMTETRYKHRVVVRDLAQEEPSTSEPSRKD